MVGPLAVRNEPGTYDLCPYHARGLSVPRGWEVIRLPLDTESDLPNDLLALADAVREAAGLETETPLPTMVEVARRGHLTLLEVQPPAST